MQVLVIVTVTAILLLVLGLVARAFILDYRDRPKAISDRIARSLPTMDRRRKGEQRARVKAVAQAGKGIHAGRERPPRKKGKTYAAGGLSGLERLLESGGQERAYHRRSA